MSPDLTASGERNVARALRMQAVFRAVDEQVAQTIAAKMIDRAHEIANLPEYECDVDVSVEWAQIDSPDGPVGTGEPGAPGARGRPPER